MVPWIMAGDRLLGQKQSHLFLRTENNILSVSLSVPLTSRFHRAAEIPAPAAGCSKGEKSLTFGKWNLLEHTVGLPGFALEGERLSLFHDSSQSLEQQWSAKVVPVLARYASVQEHLGDGPAKFPVSSLCFL